MTRRLSVFFWRSALPVLLLVPCFSCSSGGNSLDGSVGSIYDLSFNSIVITLQGTSVEIRYVGSSGDPADLVVDIANIADPSGSSINLAQNDPVTHQLRGSLHNVSDGTTTDLGIEFGSVVFNQVPTVGSNLSGYFAATLSDPSGYTLDGDFSGTVNAE
jgi:hypothetical protein